MRALLFESMTDQRVRCNLCNHRCLIGEGKRGICNVRENRSGGLESLVYGEVVSQSVDPIEKKPLFHLAPGSRSFSIATVGCNLKCRFCQNADIAQMPTDRGGLIMGEFCTPEAIAAAARRENCRSIAYTYTEPTIYFEFALDTAKLAHEAGIRNVFVTNGYMTSEALQMISPFLDAANVDLKGFTDDFYKTWCGARLEPVLETLRLMKALGVFVEVTTLLIPGLNDDMEELKHMAAFLVKDLGPDTPWHISRFHPTYHLTDRPPTPPETLTAARRIGMESGLRYVYTGNVRDEEGENTYCPGCDRILIQRRGFSIQSFHITDGRCSFCGTEIAGVDL